jgi:hypothetical protein
MKTAKQATNLLHFVTFENDSLWFQVWTNWSIYSRAVFPSCLSDHIFLQQISPGGDVDLEAKTNGLKSLYFSV